MRVQANYRESNLGATYRYKVGWVVTFIQHRVQCRGQIIAWCLHLGAPAYVIHDRAKNIHYAGVPETAILAKVKDLRTRKFKDLEYGN